MENEERPPDSVLAAQKREQRKNRVLNKGEQFGEYRVVKCLCVGLLAQYYQMQHSEDLHDVTVGIFHHRTAGNTKFLKSLESLKKQVTAFKHEAFPKIRKCTTISQRNCIFLDPVKGETLSQYFEAHGVPGQQGIGVKTTTRIVAQLLGALGYAHAQGVDHRDLDSNLIYVQKDGSLRILGLGVKAAMGVELFESVVSASVSPLTSSQQLDRLNSFDIMSPEYKSGVAEDTRVDIYAVAFVAYWLLTGRKAAMAKYEPPTKWVEAISPNWNGFFEKSFERVKDKRYQSCKMALIGLKKTHEESQSEGATFVQRQIDRIPVPKKIVERGELATRIYRLFIIGLVGLTLTGIGASFLKRLYTKDVQHPQVIARKVGMEKSPALTLRVVPPVTKVEFVAQGESFITNQGLLKLAVQPGDYKLRLSAPQRVAQVLSVTISPTADTPQALEVELKRAQAGIRVETEPGAAISVVDAEGLEVELGTADDSGSFSLAEGLLAGKYELRVEKAGYAPNVLENQRLKPATLNEIDAPLSPLPTKVLVRSQPAGTRIFIDEIEVGATPLSLENISPDQAHRLVARLEGYRPIERRIEAEPGASMTVDFGELIPLSGALQVAIRVAGANAAKPAELYEAIKVFVDGQSFPYGSAALDHVPVGEHRVWLEHPLYVSTQSIVEVEDGGEYRMEFTLSPRPGYVQLEGDDDLELELRVDGEVSDMQDNRVQIPANKTVAVALRIPNHLTMTRSFKLSPTETYVWTIEPTLIPGPEEGQDWTLPYAHIHFAWIAPGEYKMGSPLQEHARLPNEGPQTDVRFTRGFWAGVYEVTQAQYLKVVGENPASFKGAERPVESLSWREAKVFCKLLTDSERAAGRLPAGYIYRLPSEAEWEYVARAGASTAFSFGDRADASRGQFRGVYPRERKDGLRAPSDYGTAVVGSYQANAYGLFDVHGNVGEWTLDAYNARLEGGAQVDPQPRQQDERIAVRGGNWGSSAARVRSAARAGVSPELSNDALGFRVFLAPEF